MANINFRPATADEIKKSYLETMAKLKEMTCPRYVMQASNLDESEMLIPDLKCERLPKGNKQNETQYS